MNKKTLFGVVSFILIETMIIFGFIHYWPEDGNSNLMVLDIVVATVVLFALCLDTFNHWIDLSSSQPRQVGSLGIRWVTSIVYVVLAILVMSLTGTGRPNTPQVLTLSFFAILCIHLALVLLLAGGLVWALIAGDKVKEIADIEEDKMSGLALMKNALRSLCDEVMLNNSLPPSIVNTLSELSENMRYVTPSNSLEAHELEEEFGQIADGIRMEMRQYDVNEEKIQNDLSRLKILFMHRKEVLN